MLQAAESSSNQQSLMAPTNLCIILSTLPLVGVGVLEEMRPGQDGHACNRM